MRRKPKAKLYLRFRMPDGKQSPYCPALFDHKSRIRPFWCLVRGVEELHEQEVSTQELDEVEEDSFSLQLSDPSANPEQAYAQQERRNALNDAIGNLQPRLRAVVQMGPLRDLSLKETARDLRLSVAAVKGQVFHARVALRKSPVLKSIIRANNGLAA